MNAPLRSPSPEIHRSWLEFVELQALKCIEKLVWLWDSLEEIIPWIQEYFDLTQMPNKKLGYNYVDRVLSWKIQRILTQIWNTQKTQKEVDWLIIINATIEALREYKTIPKQIWLSSEIWRMKYLKEFRQTFSPILDEEQSPIENGGKWLNDYLKRLVLVWKTFKCPMYWEISGIPISIKYESKKDSVTCHIEAIKRMQSNLAWLSEESFEAPVFWWIEALQQIREGDIESMLDWFQELQWVLINDSNENKAFLFIKKFFIDVEFFFSNLWIYRILPWTPEATHYNTKDKDSYGKWLLWNALNEFLVYWKISNGFNHCKKVWEDSFWYKDHWGTEIIKQFEWKTPWVINQQVKSIIDWDDFGAPALLARLWWSWIKK